jgi:hypothetical protein
MPCFSWYGFGGLVLVLFGPLKSLSQLNETPTQLKFGVTR